MRDGGICDRAHVVRAQQPRSGEFRFKAGVFNEINTRLSVGALDEIDVIDVDGSSWSVEEQIDAEVVGAGTDVSGDDDLAPVLAGGPCAGPAIVDQRVNELDGAVVQHGVKWPWRLVLVANLVDDQI